MTLDVDEQVAVTVSIRRGVSSSSPRGLLERLLPGKRVVALRLPRTIAGGKAALTVSMTNEAGSSVDLCAGGSNSAIPPRT